MISVVIPAYNAAPFLAPAIASVLAQTFSPDEVIVVDDGSEDGSAEIAAGFGQPVRVLRLPHGGGAAALNAGVGAARGDRIAFLDADDLWAADKLARQSAALDDAPLTDAMLGRVVNFTDSHGVVVRPDQIAADAPAVSGASKNAMLIRRAAFDRVGPFDAARLADFPDWYARALARGIRFAELDAIVAYRRLHGANITAVRRSEFDSEYLRIARTAIARRTALSAEAKKPCGTS